MEKQTLFVKVETLRLIDELKDLLILQNSFDDESNCLCCTVVMEQSEGRVLSEQFDVGSVGTNVTEARYPEICRVVANAVRDYISAEIVKLKREISTI